MAKKFLSWWPLVLLSCQGRCPETADCADAQGTWAGTWYLENGDFAGLDGDIELVVLDDCSVRGTLQLYGFGNPMEGHMCRADRGTVAFEAAGIGFGEATFTVEGDTLSGSFVATIEDGNGLSPGEYRGEANATRQVVLPPPPPECPGGCNDGLSCTEDACVAGSCVFQAIEGCVESCGNGVCDSGEDCETCGADCDGLSTVVGPDGRSCGCRGGGLVGSVQLDAGERVQAVELNSARRSCAPLAPWNTPSALAEVAPDTTSVVTATERTIEIDGVSIRVLDGSDGSRLLHAAVVPGSGRTCVPLESESDATPGIPFDVPLSADAQGPFAAPDCTVQLTENYLDCDPGDLVSSVPIQFFERGAGYTNSRVYRWIDDDCVEDTDSTTAIYRVGPAVPMETFPQVRSGPVGSAARRTWLLNSQGEPLIDPNVLSSRNFETPNGECWAGVVEGTSEAVCVQSSALITVDYRRFADFFCNEPVSLSERAVVALERTDSPGGYLLPHVDLYRRGQPYDGPVYARDEQGLCVERSVPTQAFRLTPTSDLTGLTRFDVEGL